MNKLKTFKYKTHSPENGILNKFGAKLMRKSSSSSAASNKGKILPNELKSHLPSKAAIHSGSYNMTGDLSENSKLEIGEPILISKTTIDTDLVDSIDDKNRTNGTVISNNGKFCVGNEKNHNLHEEQQNSSVTATTSSCSSSVVATVMDESDTETYTDARSSLPSSIQELNSINKYRIEERNNNLSRNNIHLEDNIIKQNNHDVKILKRNRSKSTQNLHRGELRLILQKAPSLELDLKLTTANLENCFDLPRITEGESSEDALKKLKEQQSKLKEKQEHEKCQDKNILSPNLCKPKLSISEPNTPIDNPDFLKCFSTSTNSLQNGHRDSLRDSCGSYCSSNGNASMTELNNGSLEDLKSVSFQSLNAENLFLSIEELNEITRQINECEEFRTISDLEYCEHRDSLKPDEKRITLMRNKNYNRILDFHSNKSKINSAWNGFKSWIGEESDRFKEVMHRHAAMQRVGANHTNVSNNNSSVKSKNSTINIPPHRSSAPTPTSSIAKEDPKREISRTPSIQSNPTYLNNPESIESLGNEPLTSSTLSMPISSTVTSSCTSPTLVGSNFVTDNDDDDLVDHLSQRSSSLQSKNYRDISPFSKKPKLKEKWEGQNGFEELRRYIKQGGDFGKDLVAILHERVESEQLYAKSLSKMASKLNKACREIPGSIADAWRGVAAEMESRSDVHRQFSNSLIEEIVKPIKVILDNHHKTRKSVETSVDKSARVLSEWRNSEAKSKKVSHTAARENEKLQDAMLDVRIQKSPSMNLLHQANKMNSDKELKNAEKDCAKLDNKRRKAEESVKRADVEYYTLCVRAERARVDWEMSVLRGSSILQNLECQRLTNLKNFVSSYLELTSNMNPVLEQIVQRLTPQVESCNVTKDLVVVKNIRRASEGPSEQLLPDFYCEHTTLAMNRERRKHALIKLLQLVKADIERERRSRSSLKGISQALNAQDNQNIADKLYHIRSMLTYLEGARFKLHSALLELDHKPRNSHPLAPHIQITRDRTGLQQSILKVPLWLKNNDKMNDVSKDNIDYECTSQINGSCIDIKNEVLIKHFDRAFNRSKSNSEIIVHNNNQEEIHQNGKAQTLVASTNKDLPDSPEFDRGIADGGSNQQDSDFDEFSSQDEDEGPDSSQSIAKEEKIQNIEQNTSSCSNDATSIKITNSNLASVDSSNNSSCCSGSSTGDNSSNFVVISKCKALYSYTPKLYDELELTPGDIIEVHVKQEDGWWLGAHKNKVGIFPATYVEEFT